MARKRRTDQRTGYVWERYAEASSQVESLKRMAEKMVDPQLEDHLTELHRKSHNERMQAYKRLQRFDTVEAQLQDRTLEPQQIKDLRKIRDNLVAEIFIRLYHISLANDAAKRIIY